MPTFIIAALTADGFIARTAHHLSDWTSREDKQLFVRLTKQAGVMVMGSATFATIGRALPGRRTIVYTRHPERIKAEGVEIAAPGVETTSEPPAALVKRLAGEGVTGLAVCGGAQIYSLFMRAGAVDELYLTISPLLFGQGIRLFNSSLDVKLELLGQELLGQESPNPAEILLHYRVLK
jgi:dihydrofolate reductase